MVGTTAVLLGRVVCSGKRAQQGLCPTNTDLRRMGAVRCVEFVLQFVALSLRIGLHFFLSFNPRPECIALRMDWAEYNVIDTTRLCSASRGSGGCLKPSVIGDDPRTLNQQV